MITAAIKGKIRVLEYKKPVHHLLKFIQDNQLQVAFKEIYN
jgi:hypothetical protein